MLISGHKIFLGIFLGLGLAACATSSPPQVVTQIVKVPVPVRCDAKVTPRPDYPDTPALLRSAPTDRLLQLLYAGRKVRDGYITELEAANSGCSNP